jgi:CRP-like cAMP-binding protein
LSKAKTKTISNDDDDDDDGSDDVVVEDSRQENSVLTSLPIFNIIAQINRIPAGGYLGELALVTHKPRAASAYAVGDIKLACKFILLLST